MFDLEGLFDFGDFGCILYMISVVFWVWIEMGNFRLYVFRIGICVRSNVI